MTIITAYSNRSKAVIAYIAPIENGQANVIKAVYGNPASEEDLQRSHRNKSHQVKFDLTKLECGLYVMKSGRSQGSKFSYEFFRWDGEEQIFYDSLADATLSEPGLEALPELEGSEKQIKWATEIRLKVLLKVKQLSSDDQISQATINRLPVSAKVWINKADKVSEIAQKIADSDAAVRNLKGIY
jgi:hypothetical protein